MSERSNSNRSLYLLPVLALVAMVGIALYGINLWYQIDDSIDFSILHEQIMTNQTFVDQMDCNKVILTHNVLDSIRSPTQQDEVIQLRADFDQLIIDKNCGIESEIKK